jgi:deleted in liver cancer protein
LLNDSQLNDLADSLKRYFRELPECLFTNRLSKMLENVVVELPPECHFHALHLCVLLLPAENREALFILLKFLKGISRHSGTNQMCAQNLATCWMPSLFHFSTQAEQKMINGVGGGVGGTLGRKLM